MYLSLSIGQNLPPGLVRLTHLAPNYIHESSILSQITKDEISKIISSLNSSKSTGPNSVLTKILKLLKVKIPKHITDIFNLSITAGIFPNSLKSAKVIPIHKKPLKLVLSNYRPISLLCNLDKIIEKLMYNQIIQFLENNKLIYYKQFGFRKNFSTAHAFNTLIKNVQSALENNKFAFGIFIDLKQYLIQLITYY